jgi:hypothetical protein
MGFLTINGMVLSFDEYKERVQYYKDKGIEEFLSLYKVHADKRKEREDLKWGEEIEYALFKYDSPEKKTLKLGLVGDMIMDFNEKSQGTGIQLHPEFGQWMVEAVPSEPYNSIENP